MNSEIYLFLKAWQACREFGRFAVLTPSGYHKGRGADLPLCASYAYWSTQASQDSTNEMGWLLGRTGRPAARPFPEGSPASENPDRNAWVAQVTKHFEREEIYKFLLVWQECAERGQFFEGSPIAPGEARDSRLCVSFGEWLGRPPRGAAAMARVLSASGLPSAFPFSVQEHTGGPHMNPLRRAWVKQYLSDYQPIFKGV